MYESFIPIFVDKFYINSKEIKFSEVHIAASYETEALDNFFQHIQFYRTSH